MKKLNNVLYCVLNWGLGHASRSIPIIELLISKGITVEIASDGEALIKLKNEFSGLTFHNLPAYNIQYSKSGAALAIKLLCQLPKLINSIKAENSETKKITENKKFDLISSDNRYGCYSKLIPSVIISHQLQIKTPFGFSWINKSNKKLLQNYSKIWVPDSNDNLSGELSMSSFSHSKIGFLSSYHKTNCKKDIDILLTLSGPEPQRSLLEKKLLGIIPKNKKVVLVRGTSSPIKYRTSLETYDMASRKTMNELLNRSKLVVSRSGYSSLMDYKTLGLPAILIPTPGQTEQEYFETHLKNDTQFYFVNQENINMEIFDQKKVNNLISQKNLDENSDEVLLNSLKEMNFIMPT